MGKKKVDKTVSEKDPRGMIQDRLEAKINAELTQYGYGDLFITCSNCGTDNLVNANVKSTNDKEENIGINVGKVLGVNSRDHFGLGCSNCKTSLVIHFRDAVNPPEEEVVPTDPVVEDVEVIEEEFIPEVEPEVVEEEN